MSNHLGPSAAVSLPQRQSIRKFAMPEAEYDLNM